MLPPLSVSIVDPACCLLLFLPDEEEVSEEGASGVPGPCTLVAADAVFDCEEQSSLAQSVTRCCVLRGAGGVSHFGAAVPLLLALIIK